VASIKQGTPCQAFAQQCVLVFFATIVLAPKPSVSFVDYRQETDGHSDAQSFVVCQAPLHLLESQQTGVLFQRLCNSVGPCVADLVV
jgi:hypothetical protein